MDGSQADLRIDRKECFELDRTNPTDGSSSVLPSSILKVYAWMRGDLSNTPGPLYHQAPDGAMIPLATPGVFTTREAEKDCHREHGGPDPDHPLASPLSESTRRNWSTESVFEEPLADTHARSAAGHLDSAFESYGYVNINGTWVDPDSEQMVQHAFHGASPAALPRVPGDGGDGGGACPAVLHDPELAAEYDEFCAFVSDEEGDPRTLHIHPRTFVKWAEGVRRVPQRLTQRSPLTAKTETTPASKPRSSLRQRRHSAPKALNFSAQFDILTGEPISPSYSIEESPSPLLTPTGLNLGHCPDSFKRSYPQEAKKLDRLLYSLENESQKDASVPSQPELFTTAELITALSRDADQDDGVRQYLEIADRVAFLTDERERLWCEIQGGYGVNQALGERVARLEREVVLLRAQQHQKQLLLSGSPGAESPPEAKAETTRMRSKEEKSSPALAPLRRLSPRLGSQERHLDQVRHRVEMLQQDCSAAAVTVHELRAASDTLRSQEGDLMLARLDLLQTNDSMDNALTKGSSKETYNWKERKPAGSSEDSWPEFKGVPW